MEIMKSNKVRSIAGAGVITGAVVFGVEAMETGNLKAAEANILTESQETVDIENGAGHYDVDGVIPTFDCAVDIDGSAQLITLEDGRKFVRTDIGASKQTDPTVRDDEHKLATANLSTPIDALALVGGKEKVLTAVQTAVCEDPLLGMSIANMVRGINVDGQRVDEVNQFLADLPEGEDAINDNAASMLPVMFDGYPQATEEYEEFAETLNTLLDRFVNEGVQGEISTTENYELGARGAQVALLPEVVVNQDQYEGTFLVFELTDKEGNCEIRFLINVDDKRPALQEDYCESIITTTTPDGTVTTTTMVTTTTERTTTSTTTTPGSSTTTSVPTTTTGRKGVPATTIAPPSTTERPSTTTLIPAPSTSSPDTLPVTPTTIDRVPPTSTIQHPDGPPITSAPPTTEAPPATIPPTETTLSTGTVPSR